VRSRVIASSICLFCEDIRHEQNNVDTLVGVLPDNINIATAPVLLPKLALYFVTVFPLSKVPTTISVRLQTPWPTELVNLGAVSQEQIANAVNEAREQGSDGVKFISKTIVSPFNIQGPGKIAAITSIDNRSILAGILRFKIIQQS
jgi:hypothetical protein